MSSHILPFLVFAFLCSPTGLTQRLAGHFLPPVPTWAVSKRDFHLFPHPPLQPVTLALRCSAAFWLAAVDTHFRPWDPCILIGRCLAVILAVLMCCLLIGHDVLASAGWLALPGSLIGWLSSHLARSLRSLYLESVSSSCLALSSV